MLSVCDRHEWKDDCLLCDASAYGTKERREKILVSRSPDFHPPYMEKRKAETLNDTLIA